MEWIKQNLLLSIGIIGFIVFLLSGLIAAVVLKKKLRQIEHAIQGEYEQNHDSITSI